MICAIHNKEMKQNAKGWYCSTPVTKSADGTKVLEWCTWKPGNENPSSKKEWDNSLKNEPVREPVPQPVYSDQRSQRIERQHSQEMAIRALELMQKVNPDVLEGEITTKGLMETIKKYADQFVADLEPALEKSRTD